MFTEAFITSIVFLSEISWISCGKATVPFKECEQKIEIEAPYRNSSPSLNDSVLKTGEDFRKLIWQGDVEMKCPMTQFNVTVEAIVIRSKYVTVFYNMSIRFSRLYLSQNTLNATSEDLFVKCIGSIEYEFSNNPNGTRVEKALTPPGHPVILIQLHTKQKCEELKCPLNSTKINYTCECSPGNYLNSPYPKCTPCPADTYQNETGMFNCTSCPSGSTTFGQTGSTKKENCIPAPPPLEKQCSPGRYPNIPTQECTPCPADTYQNRTGMFNCTSCPSGSTTLGKTGSTHKGNCIPDRTGSSSAVAIALSITAVVIVILLIAALFWYRRRKKQLRKKLWERWNDNFTSDESNDEDEREESCPTLGPLESEVINRNLEIPRDMIKRTGVKLGKGQFGEVHQVLIKKPNEPEMLCAAKMAKGSNSRVTVNDMLDELEIHLELEGKHENVVNILGVCSKGEGPFYLIMEFCENGCLHDYLQEHKEMSEYLNSPGEQPLSLTWRLNRTLEICDGMKFLARQKIVHRDLAARNVLLDSNVKAKIADFGMAKDVYVKAYYKERNEGAFPLRWMAMESIQNLSFSEKTDVWSFGVLVWEIFTDGMYPYYAIISDEKVAYYIMSGKKLKKPETCPKWLYSVLLKCWSNKHYNRPNFKELLDLLNENVKRQEQGKCSNRRSLKKMITERKMSLKQTFSRRGSKQSTASMDNLSQFPQHSKDRKQSENSFEKFADDQNIEMNRKDKIWKTRENPGFLRKYESKELLPRMDEENSGNNEGNENKKITDQAKENQTDTEDLPKNPLNEEGIFQTSQHSSDDNARPVKTNNLTEIQQGQEANNSSGELNKIIDTTDGSLSLKKLSEEDKNNVLQRECSNLEENTAKLSKSEDKNIATHSRADLDNTKSFTTESPSQNEKKEGDEDTFLSDILREIDGCQNNGYES